MSQFIQHLSKTIVAHARQDVESPWFYFEFLYKSGDMQCRDSHLSFPFKYDRVAKWWIISSMSQGFNDHKERVTVTNIDDALDRYEFVVKSDKDLINAVISVLEVIILYWNPNFTSYQCVPHLCAINGHNEVVPFALCGYAKTDSRVVLEAMMTRYLDLVKVCNNCKETLQADENKGVKRQKT